MMIDRIAARNVAGRTNVMIEGIVVRTKVVSDRTSVNANRKKSVMV